MQKSNIGILGLAVMGANLAINMESKGFTVSVYNRTTEKVTKPSIPTTSKCFRTWCWRP